MFHSLCLIYIDLSICTLPLEVDDSNPSMGDSISSVDASCPHRIEHHYSKSLSRDIIMIDDGTNVPRKRLTGGLTKCNGESFGTYWGSWKNPTMKCIKKVPTMCQAK